MCLLCAPEEGTGEKKAIFLSDGTDLRLHPFMPLQFTAVGLHSRCVEKSLGNRVKYILYLVYVCLCTPGIYMYVYVYILNPAQKGLQILG